MEPRGLQADSAQTLRVCAKLRKCGGILDIAVRRDNPVSATNFDGGGVRRNPLAARGRPMTPECW